MVCFIDSYPGQDVQGVLQKRLDEASNAFSVDHRIGSYKNLSNFSNKNHRFQWSPSSRRWLSWRCSVPFWPIAGSSIWQSNAPTTSVSAKSSSENVDLHDAHGPWKIDDGHNGNNFLWLMWRLLWLMWSTWVRGNCFGDALGLKQALTLFFA